MRVSRSITAQRQQIPTLICCSGRLSDSSEGGLSYALAIRVLGELREFMMRGGVEGARFEVQGLGGRRIGGGWLVKGYAGTRDT